MSTKMLYSFVRFTFIAFVVCLSPSLYAQFSASLAGTVEDASGAIIPKATVVLTNLGTQQTQTAISSATGFYRFNELSPAHYKLVITAPGFKTSTFDDISLAAETPRNLNVNLAIGGASDTVNVSATTHPLCKLAMPAFKRPSTARQFKSSRFMELTPTRYFA
jgi:hypothetical protein